MPADASAALVWAPLAWLPGGWRAHVVLRAGVDGRWSEVSPGVATPPPGARILAGPLLPGVVDAHSHAFQRAFAGAAERREARHDDFWSWRERMYAVAPAPVEPRARRPEPMTHGCHPLSVSASERSTGNTVAARVSS